MVSVACRDDVVAKAVAANDFHRDQAAVDAVTSPLNVTVS